MKKTALLLLLCFLSLLTIILASCEEKSTYRPQTVHVAFYTEKGAEKYDKQQVSSGELLREPSVPTKEGYEFLGWYHNDKKWNFKTDTVSKNMILLAKWNQKESVLSFNPNGGEGEISDIILKSFESATIPKNSFTRDGYFFVGWATSPDATSQQALYKEGDIYEVGEEKSYTLYAIWEPCDAMVIAIDLSSSMGVAVDETSTNKNGGLLTRYDMVKDSILSFIESCELGEKAFIGVVLFDSEAITAVPLTAITDKTLIAQRLENSMESYFYNHTDEQNPSYDNRILVEDGKMDANGYSVKSYGTMYQFPLHSASSMLSDVKGECRLIFISDGEPGDYGAYDSVVERMALHGTAISAIMIGNDSESARNTLLKMATAGKGKLYSPTRPSDLEQIFNAILAESDDILASTLSFDLNGGRGSIEDKNLSAFESVFLPKGSFYKEGYCFKGWSSTKDGAAEYTGGEIYTIGAEGKYTLYAIWELSRSISIVIDISSSMGNYIDGNQICEETGLPMTRFDMVKEALEEALYKCEFNEVDHVCVILLNEEAAVAVPVTQATEIDWIIDSVGYELESRFYYHTDENHPTVENRVTGVGTQDKNGYSIKSHGTNYMPAITLTLESTDLVEPSENRIIFISDGEPADINSGYMELIADAASEGIITSTIMIGNDSSNAVNNLSSMADAGKGGFYQVKSLYELESALLELFQSIVLE